MLVGESRRDAGSVMPSNDDAWDVCNYGKWEHDEAGLPCFDLNPLAGPEHDAPLRHLLSTGRLVGLADRWGGLSLFTTDGGRGYQNFGPDIWRYRSPAYGQLFLANEIVSLSPREMTCERTVRYGVGYARYTGEANCTLGTIALDESFIATLNGDTGICFTLALQNRTSVRLQGVLRISSDFRAASGSELPNLAINCAAGASFASWHDPPLGYVGLVGPKTFMPGRRCSRMLIERSIELDSGATFEVNVWVGYGDPRNVEIIRGRMEPNVLDAAQRYWAARLSGVSMSPPEPWMKDECVWAAGQLVAFTSYDGASASRYTALGGYGWKGFGVRECTENAIALGRRFPDLALDALGWTAHLQFTNGNLARGYNFANLQSAPEDAPDESDNELWLLLAATELADDLGKSSFLDALIPYRDGGTASIWEHLRAAFSWIHDRVGVGAHGLMRIWNGDWNDYLCNVGREGRGESVMNTGIACRALPKLAAMAAQRKDPVEGQVVRFCRQLQQAMSQAFDRTHFIRGYTDAGVAFGTHEENRVFLDAQIWAVLGRCGAKPQRRQALRHALEQCESSFGLTLMSRPLPCPPPEELGQSPIPSGEGENAGIWPQTVYWFAWALAEEGMLAEAADLWKKMSLRNHMKLFPSVPFGIFNGPDCYSSHHAGPDREGRTQVEPVSRAEHVPMVCPVAWQCFAAEKIWGTAKER